MGIATRGLAANKGQAVVVTHLIARCLLAYVLGKRTHTRLVPNYSMNWRIMNL